jgi:uncharacterized protein
MFLQADSGGPDEAPRQTAAGRAAPRLLTIVFVPGLRDHDPNHWQSRLAAEIAESVTVEPIRENRMSRAARVAALDRTLAGIDGDVILVAHSAGVLVAAHWAQAPTRPIRAALLVTPADVERPLPEGYPRFDALAEHGWMPMPRDPLPFPSLVVASRNDPLAERARVEALAFDWGAKVHDAGEVGHLNPAAGFGPWPLGRELLARIISETH